MQALVITGIAVSSLFIIFILFRKTRKRSDYLLALINLLMIGFLVIDIVVRQRLTITALFIQTLLPYYLMTIFLYFALEFLPGVAAKWRLIIVIPVVVSTFYVAADMFLIHHYDPQSLIRLYNDPPVGYHIVFKGNQILFVIALVFIIRRLRNYAHDIKDIFSLTEPIQLEWLLAFSFIYLVIVIISLISFTAANLRLLPVNTEIAYSIVSIGTVLAIFYLSFHGIRQYSIADYYGKHAVAHVAENPVPTIGEVEEKYRTSSLSKAEQELIYNNLLTLLEQKNVYREPKLQLSDVAVALGVSTHELSQTINTLAGMPFYDLVNGYRVRRLKSLLEDPAQKRFTILALGLESGFNSKASLNRVFKEVTGLSPSEYQKQNLRR